MAAATAVVFESTEVDRPAELRAKHQQLLATAAELRNENRALHERNRELERELMLIRFDGGELPPKAIGNALTAEVWLTWAHDSHHTDACACHRCHSARRVLNA